MGGFAVFMGKGAVGDCKVIFVATPALTLPSPSGEGFPLFGFGDSSTGPTDPVFVRPV